MTAVTYISWLSLLVLCAPVLGKPPIDTPSRCGNARKPTNGAVVCARDDQDWGHASGGKSSSGSSSKGPDIYTCKYSCDRGYQLNGPSVIECPIDKITDNPTCEAVECSALPTIEHGYLNLNCSRGFQFGSVCHYSCASGFNISGGNNGLLCEANGMWQGVVPMCEPVQCPPLSEPNHGSLHCPNGRTFGSDCRYTCDNRYVLDGSPVATCSATGQWSYTTAAKTPKCKLGECPQLPLLTHGSLTCTKGWDIGSICSYNCHEGFSLTGGNYLISCRYNGYWRGDLPTCQRDWVELVAPANRTNNTLCYCSNPPPNAYPDFPMPNDEDSNPTSSPSVSPTDVTETQTTTELTTDDYYTFPITTSTGGNSTGTEFALYDIFDDKSGTGGDGPSGIVGPGSSDTGSGNVDNGVGTPAIVAIVAVVLILMAVVAGIFVTRRVGRTSQDGYGSL